MSRTCRIAITALACVALAGGAASAQSASSQPVQCTDQGSPSVMASARRHFAAGQTLVVAGAFLDAERELRAALRLYDSPNTHYLLGRALQGEGRLADAYNEFDGTIGLAARCATSDRSRYEETVARALHDRDAVAARVALVGIRAPDGAPNDLAVTANGAPVPADWLGRPRAFAAADTEVRATASGMETFSTVVHPRAGAVTWVDLRLRATPVAPPPVAHPTPAAPTTPIPSVATAPPPEAHGSALRPAGIVVAAIGVVAAGVGATLYFVGHSQFQQIDMACGGTACPPNMGYESRLASVQTDETVGLIALWSGVGVGAIGLVLAIAGGGSHEAAPAHASIAPVVDPVHRVAGITVRF